MKFATHSRVIVAGAILAACSSVVSADAPATTPAATTFPAYWNNTQRAADLAFHGQYAAALLMLEHATGGDPADAAIVRATCLAAMGHADQALKLLDNPALADNQKAALERIRILIADYRPSDAQQRLKQLLKQFPQVIESHYLLGSVDEQLGDLDAGRKAYAWFDDQHFLQRWQQNPDAPVFGSARDVVCIGRALDRLATLNGSYKAGQPLHQQILNLFVRSYDVIDREYWPAHLAAAEYLYRYDQTKLAGEELAAALKANPASWRALNLAGRMALAQFDFDRADKAIGAMRKTNAHSIAADILEARSLLRQRKFADAQHIMENVLNRRPNNIEALGLLASSQALQPDSTAHLGGDDLPPSPGTPGEGRGGGRANSKSEVRNPKEIQNPAIAISNHQSQISDFKSENTPTLALPRNTRGGDKPRVHRTLARLAKLAPHDATAYNELGDQLSALRQYDRAAVMYKIAIERAPWWSAPRNGLGLLYTQSGDEKGARAVLTAAHAIDPFNLRTTNYLRLLDDLDHLASKQTAHFIIRYDAKQDAVLAEYLPAYLEQIYPIVCDTFDHNLRRKTTIEIFPTRAEFSVRTTGMPGIDTVGACTGPVIALVAPRGQEPTTLGNYNWAEVLRHEFTHTVTLAATDNRISQWFTEGLATWQEGTPIRWEWVPMLYEAATKHKLFTIPQLTWAFIRPKKPIDRQLAYAESRWICQYIHDRFGAGAIVKMLAAYKRGEPETQVFQAALGMSDSEFSSQFSTWARQQVSAWGYDADTTTKCEQLQNQAQEMIKAKQYSAAISLWRQIQQLRPMDELPHKRLAGLYLQTHDPQNAIAQLKILSSLSLKNNAYAKAIAKLYRALGDNNGERQFAMQAVYIDPYDVAAHELLADAAQRLGDTAAVKREQKVISLIHASSGTQMNADEH